MAISLANVAVEALILVGIINCIQTEKECSFGVPLKVRDKFQKTGYLLYHWIFIAKYDYKIVKR